MNITDEMVKAYWAAEARVWQTEAPITQGDAVVVNRAATRAGIEAVAPLIAAQAALAERIKIATEVRRHAEHVARTLGSSRAASIAVAAIENEVADRINALPAPDQDCCNAPNMVWEHSRGPKDHFRCVACGGGMTKARATS